MNDRVIARLAAANPVPRPPRMAAGQLARARLSRRTAAVAVAILGAAVLVPTLALADISGRLGFSNEGTPVATSETPFAQVSSLNEALEELRFPSTLQLLGRRDGMTFYGAKRPDGSFCFAVESGAGKGVGCDLSGAFPSERRPILDFSRFSHGARMAGFAADGVSTVALMDPSGTPIATAKVIGNIYANADPPPGGVAVEARDGEGNVVYRRSFDEAP